MNVALEQTEEYSNGRLTGRFGECFLRGNNGMSTLSDSNPSPLPVARVIGNQYYS